MRHTVPLISNRDAAAGRIGDESVGSAGLPGDLRGRRSSSSGNSASCVRWGAAGCRRSISPSRPRCTVRSPSRCCGRSCSSDETILKRFEQEAKAAAGLIHPNIVQVYSFGQQDGLYYIAQEYVQGMNLRQLLNRHGPPELLVAYHIMRQVAAALTVAGEAGIVHRDIKPENILITRKGEAKVADFGLAQLAESEHRVQLTQVGMTMGTPLYMSPEQINGEAVDHRSDIYSFGVTCYRMLAGRPPFRGDTTLTLGDAAPDA